ncbi:hypothetical protein GUJ93_ZPchr0010g9712 [Zizania palustris]|uniref:Serine aminopeptidase S33 domain-containing protein n=1 Tax=Zizania palustris TaxID=103762 RepID=A0A8J6BG54_ZIZPA|nr:hypothetical protein GUJ93_ZPchr0010g9712 [Zizania palustris]
MILMSDSVKVAEIYTAIYPTYSDDLEQRVVVTNKHGEKLAGVLHHMGSSKIIVLCHGFIATKNDSLILDLTDALTEKGICVFHFDFSGNGESEGEFEYGNYRKEADDLQCVVSYLWGNILCNHAIVRSGASNQDSTIAQDISPISFKGKL